jgi:hypothetical protein
MWILLVTIYYREMQTSCFIQEVFLWALNSVEKNENFSSLKRTFFGAAYTDFWE